MATNGTSCPSVGRPSPEPLPPLRLRADLSPRAQDPIEQKIAEAVASGVIAIVAAVDGYLQHGVIDPVAKDTSATWMAKVAELQLDYEVGDEAFVCTARNAGRRALRKYFDADFFRRHGQADADAAIDLYIGDLLTIVGNVVHDERIFRVRGRTELLLPGYFDILVPREVGTEGEVSCWTGFWSESAIELEYFVNGFVDSVPNRSRNRRSQGAVVPLADALLAEPKSHG